MSLNKKLLSLYLLFAISLCVVAAWQLPKLQFNNDILALFPSSTHEKHDAKLKKMATDALNTYASQRVAFLIGHPAPDKALENALEFAKALHSPILESVSVIRDTDTQLALNEHYQRYGFLLFTNEDRNTLVSSPQRLSQKRLRTLYTKPGLLTTDALIYDPLGSGARFLNRQIKKDGSALSLADNTLQVETEGKTWVLVDAQLNASPFSLDTQAQFFSTLHSAKNQVLPSATPNNLNSTNSDISILQSGAIFFAYAGTEQAKQEISTVGLGSAIGIFVLLLAVFLSLRALVFSLLPTATGVLFGLLICHAVFGQVHVIALVFGASLVGVSIDYAFHFLSSRLHAQKLWHAERAILQLRGGLSLGVISSAGAYLTFTLSGFPGFQQIAVFSASGLLAACVTVGLLFPFVFTSKSKPNSVANTVIVLLEKYASLFKPLAQFSFLSNKVKVKSTNTFSESVLSSYGGAVIGVLVCIGLFLLILTSTPRFADDIRNMQSLSEPTLQEHKRFSDITAIKQPFQSALLGASSHQALLEKLETLKTKTSVLTDIGSESIADWIPSNKTQKENLSLLNRHFIDTQIAEDLFRNIQLQAESKARFFKLAESESTTELMDFHKTRQLIEKTVPRPWLLEHEKETYAFIQFDSPLTATQKQALSKATPELIWLDPTAETNTFLRLYRERSLFILAGAFLLTFTIASLRYGVNAALFVNMPPLLACLLTTLILSLINHPLSLFNMMALVLILGIGIDYSIFVKERSNEAGSTLFAVLLSTLTTILSFGLLSLSATQAISSFGLTVFIGITLCFFFAPIAKLGTAKS